MKNAGYSLIEVAFEKDNSSCYKSFGQTLCRDTQGVNQLACIGVTTMQGLEVESPERVD